MSDVITTQPHRTSKDNYDPVATDNPNMNEEKENLNTDETEEINLKTDDEDATQKNKKRNERSSSYVDPDCCFFVGEDNFLFQYFCCRMISDCLVGCGRCTESCCEKCGSCLCDCNDNTDNIAPAADTSCCSECCGNCDVEELKKDCCSCNDCCDCGDCDCGDCDCDCGDCDCGDCDCSCFG